MSRVTWQWTQRADSWSLGFRISDGDDGLQGFILRAQFPWLSHEDAADWRARIVAALDAKWNPGQPAPADWATTGCGACYECLYGYGKNSALAMMVVCPTCGNKRCPKATRHDLGCTGSNAPGQEGSRY